MAAVWILHVFGRCLSFSIVRSHPQYFMQKWLVVFPITAAIYNFENSVYLFTCPWDSDDIVVYLVLVVEQVFSMVTVICTTTLVNTLMYMFSFGW